MNNWAWCTGNGSLEPRISNQRLTRLMRRWPSLSRSRPSLQPRRKDKQRRKGDQVCSVKEKTSIALSSDILASIDRLVGSRSSRFSFIERVLRRYLRERERAE